LTEVWDFGEVPSAGYFLNSNKDLPPVGPLSLVICTNCDLVQLNHNYDLNVLFKNYYGYASNINETMSSHLSDIAQETLRFFREAVNPLKPIKVLEIGSNDGTLLRKVSERFAIEAYAVDPTVKQYRDLYKNVVIYDDFFNYHFATSNFGKDYFDVIYSIAMFYDLHNPVDFAQGVRHVLNRNGIWVIEVSYLPLVLQRNAFDSICHEHLEYYRLQDILNIASQADLRIVDFSTNDSNGGSLRVFLSRNDSDYGANDLKLSQFLHEEPSGKLLRNQLKIMRSNIEKSGAEIREIISHWKEDSERVFALGASTKGNILLNYFGLDKLGIEGVIDRNPSKVGKFTPVGCLPIFAEDYTLSLAKWKAIVLPWHFKKSILNREIGRKVRNQEVALLFPLPELEMVNIN
jgi:hypothetical protein